MKISNLKDEVWYGGLVAEGIHMPFRNRRVKISKNMSENQAVPMLISNKGRYIYSEAGFDAEITEEFVNIEKNTEEVILNGDGSSLREALCNIKGRFAPQNGVYPAEILFRYPQYCTWIELIYEQNQRDIIRYAEDILKNGFPRGVIIIDDTWQTDYGVWEFNPERFSDPKGMVEKLHSMGFAVMLWICPFISPDSMVFRELRDKKLLVCDKDGEVAIRKWWNGYSAVLDFTNPEAVGWFEEKCGGLISEYGVDGFKFDAGDPIHYEDDDLCFCNTSANGQSELYAKFGTRYAFNEYRSCFKCTEEGLVQRLSDKAHSWGETGLAALVPNGIAAGLCGYPYVCPDMIGGGSFKDFTDGSDSLDEELVIRYAQCAALFPVMQFSAAPWRVLSEFGAGCCRNAAELHIKYGDYIMEEVRKSAKTGEAILRHMEYEFSNQGFENITSQYMLGSRILVAPVLEKGKTTVDVVLPQGKWRCGDGEVIDGGRTVEMPAPLDTLLYFIKE